MSGGRQPLCGAKYFVNARLGGRHDSCNARASLYWPAAGPPGQTPISTPDHIFLLTSYPTIGYAKTIQNARGCLKLARTPSQGGRAGLNCQVAATNQVSPPPARSGPPILGHPTRPAPRRQPCAAQRLQRNPARSTRSPDGAATTYGWHDSSSPLRAPSSKGGRKRRPRAQRPTATPEVEWTAAAAERQADSEERRERRSARRVPVASLASPKGGPSTSVSAAPQGN